VIPHCASAVRHPAFCVLHLAFAFWFCILHSAFCCILHSVCILHFAFCILHFAFCLHSAFMPLPLFDPPALPEGFLYRPDFVDAGEEEDLVGLIRGLSFQEVRMHGVIARRRIVQFGWRYHFDRRGLDGGEPLPRWLDPLQDRAAVLAGLMPKQLSEVLVTEYTPGATIGWHRDAPPFGVVVGVSLHAACRMRFRRGDGATRERAECQLDPRSAYVLQGPARSEWQHSIPAVTRLRYSITFRTLKSPRAVAQRLQAHSSGDQ